MKVKEVAALTGISVRTLHHYDAIGLLTPDDMTEAGYRLYSDDNLAILQQILFFRELGFPLKKIKELLDSPTFDRQEAFEMQHKMLLEKRQKLDEMIETIEKTIQQGRGEIIMSNEEKFKGFDFSHNPYEQEARERWGNEAVDKSNKKVAQFGPEIQEEMNQIYSKLASLRHSDSTSDEAQAAIGDWFNMLNNNFGTYSPEAFEGLGQAYVDDERFTKNIDQFGEGLAVFMRDAMAVYAQKLRGEIN
ncbi:MerR family transcriptional regulator [Sporosarcina ureilytica]|uniref:MerR family transcriptional regulator n=1 Tax=Sporosarcina ureilytica TaxID=298596 RepID=A0A1D8JCZ3_9BACL|nr:MerR family transcriptional regulator [Sporosarcina ureilytica]AOV06572.1 MerR family transcriptional regulator [Sporosarcina ureilytica]